MHSEITLRRSSGSVASLQGVLGAGGGGREAHKVVCGGLRQ
jgi:hypothetical protein